MIFFLDAEVCGSHRGSRQRKRGSEWTQTDALNAVAMQDSIDFGASDFGESVN